MEDDKIVSQFSTINFERNRKYIDEHGNFKGVPH